MANDENGEVDLDRCGDSPPAVLDNSNSNELEGGSSSTCKLPSYRPRYPHWHVWRAADALDPTPIDDDGNGGGTGTGAGITGGREPPKRSWLCGEEQTDNANAYSVLVRESAAVLRYWGRRFEGRPEMRSFANKKSLLHEVEESVVATRVLLDWLDGHPPSSSGDAAGTSPPPVTVVDLCAGKGIFSVLLSYLAGRPGGALSGRLSRIKRCIMVERETDIDWTHVGEANRDVIDSTSSGGGAGAAIPIDIWDGCDVHEDDALSSRLRASVTDMHDGHHCIVLVGIHLCRTLSPRCVGIYNKLGPHLCPLLCLAPCCLPRLASFDGRDEIPVARYETEEERRRRYGEYERARRARGKCCAVCGSMNHGTRGCPTLPVEDEEERLRMLREAAPCWRCGESGHQRFNCPTLLEVGRGAGGVRGSCRPALPMAPTFRSIDLQAVRESSSPFDGYCSALADAVQLHTDTKEETDGFVHDCNVRGSGVVGGGIGTVELRVTPLAGRLNHHSLDLSSGVSPESHGDADGVGNWNANRKCTWIVAAR